MQKEAAQLVKTRQKTVAVTEAARVKRLAGKCCDKPQGVGTPSE